MGMDSVIRKIKLFWVNCWKCFEKNVITPYFLNFTVKEGSQVVLRKKNVPWSTLCQKYYRFPLELCVF